MSLANLASDMLYTYSGKAEVEAAPHVMSAA